MCQEQSKAIQRAISMLYRYKCRGVYIIHALDGSWHACLALHYKGVLTNTVGLDEKDEIAVIAW